MEAQCTMEYIIAPRKGKMSSLIRLGHLLGGGLRHSSSGSGLRFDGPFDMHLLDTGDCVAVKKLGCNVR
jgi:hypothetical protein